jgi:hypothetical protein
MMTREQAIEKVNKLLAMAESPSANPNEKANAEKQAKRIMNDYHLTGDDLRASGKIAAFDQIASDVKNYVAKHPQVGGIESIFLTPAFISDMLGQAHGNLTPQNKVALIDKITSGLRLAHLLFGNSNQTVNDLRAIIESALKSHGLPT